MSSEIIYQPTFTEDDHEALRGLLNRASARHKLRRKYAKAGGALLLTLPARRIGPAIQPITSTEATNDLIATAERDAIQSLTLEDDFFDELAIILDESRTIRK